MNKVVFYHLSFDAVADYVLAITTASKIKDCKRAMSRHFRMFRGNRWLITIFKLENGNVELRSGERDFNEKTNGQSCCSILCRFEIEIPDLKSQTQIYQSPRILYVSFTWVMLLA